MKNFEKHIDKIANFLGESCGPCDACPCKEECFSDEDHKDCKDFFQFWAMKEAEE